MGERPHDHRPAGRRDAGIGQSSAELHWSHADKLGIDPAAFKRSGVHIHVPGGATPKDRPSARVNLATALASLYAASPARIDTAMTGEITLTGLVLPIGGGKEKVLAARRAGILRIILRRRTKRTCASCPTIPYGDGIHSECGYRVR